MPAKLHQTDGAKAKNFGATFKRLAKYLKPQLPAILVMCLCTAVSIVFNLTATLLVAGYAVTELANAFNASRQVDMTYVVRLVTLALTAYTLSGALDFVSGFLAAKLSQAVGYRMRAQMKDKLDEVPLSYYDGTTHGELLSRVVNDVDLITNSLQQSITQLISGAFTIVGIFVIMLIVSPWMTLVTVVSLPISALIAFLIASNSQKQFMAQQRELGSLNGHIEEMYSGHNVVKLYGLEQSAIDEFEVTNRRLKIASAKAQTFSGMIMPLIKLVNNLTYVALCFLGAYLVMRDMLAIGMIAVFIKYSRQFMDPVIQISQIANVIQSTVAASERVFQVLDEPEETRDIDELSTVEAVKLLDRDNLLEKVALTEEQKRELLANTGCASLFDVPAEALADVLTEGQAAALKTPASPEQVVGKVRFDRVDFSYDKSVELIKDMDLEIKPGDNIAIVGPTGAGKTTLVNLLMRFYEIDKGSIDLDGQDIRDFKRSDLRAQYGMVLQDTWLFSGTIADNIAYGRPTASREEIVAAAKKAHIHHFITTLPNGYDTVLREDAADISQGQKQLLTIARAILADRKILILDEATSSVDTRTEAYIQNAMTAMMEGKTSFVIAHRLSTIKNADLIIVMNKGRVIEHGNHRELLEKGGFYADLYNSQFNNTPLAG